MKVAVLISGGVDSSVSLKLLKEAGYEVVAFYLKIWLEDELSYLGECPWQVDLSYIQEICVSLNVPLHVISLQQEYADQVVSYTINEVRLGRTPSPDILCNQFIKFGIFYNKIDASFDYVATGHYAQLERSENGVFLKKAVDSIKDQTYFLSRLTQTQLSRALFPIGHLHKAQVRELAQKFGLPNQSRKDSQGICFLGKFKFADFIKHHLGVRPGNFIEYETGKIIGQHEGFWYFTVGQRKGMRLSGGPWFVVSKDPQNNIVYISRRYYDKDKERSSFQVNNFHWINEYSVDFFLKDPASIVVKIRHGEHAYKAKVSFLNDDNTKAHVTISESDQGIAPGQFAVFYNKDFCLGSGIIEE